MPRSREQASCKTEAWRSKADSLLLWAAGSQEEERKGLSSFSFQTHLSHVPLHLPVSVGRGVERLGARHALRQLQVEGVLMEGNLRGEDWYSAPTTAHPRGGSGQAGKYLRTLAPTPLCLALAPPLSPVALPLFIHLRICSRTLWVLRKAGDERTY